MRLVGRLAPVGLAVALVVFLVVPGEAGAQTSASSASFVTWHGSSGHETLTLDALGDQIIPAGCWVGQFKASPELDPYTLKLGSAAAAKLMSQTCDSFCMCFGCVYVDGLPVPVCITGCFMCCAAAEGTARCACGISPAGLYEDCSCQKPVPPPG